MEIDQFSEGLVEDRTKLLIECLLKFQTNEVCFYQEILKAIGKDKMDMQARAIISKSRRRLLKDHNMVFDTVRKQGLKRLSDEDIVKLGANGVKQIRKSAQRTTQKMVTVDYEKLSDQGKTTHNTFLSVLGTLSAIAQPSKIAAVQREVQNSKIQLSIGSTLEALK